MVILNYKFDRVKCYNGAYIRVIASRIYKTIWLLFRKEISRAEMEKKRGKRENFALFSINSHNREESSNRTFGNGRVVNIFCC